MLNKIEKSKAPIDQPLSQINLSNDIETEIRNAAFAGREITTHTNPIDFFGSEVVGYIIIDPQTGAGAYKICGGENGGFMDIDEEVDKTFWVAGLLPVPPDGGYT